MAKAKNTTKTASRAELQKEIDGRRKEIKTDGYPMSIGELVNLYKDHELDIHPEFQRFFRWTETQKSRWIESVLLGIPLPSVFVAQRADGVWDVVDGLQRLSTLFQLMGILKDEHGKALPPLILSATKYLKALEGKTWQGKNGLTIEQQRDIKRAKLHIQIVLRESDPSSKYELFQRLNTGGSSLSDQELRNCLLISIKKEIYDWLTGLSHEPVFQRCLGLTDRLVSEQYDLELVLRFLLLRTLNQKDFPKFGTAIGEFLTDKMIEFAEQQNPKLAAEKKAFLSVFQVLADSLEDDAFRKYDRTQKRFVGGFSISAFEVIALGLGCYAPAHKFVDDPKGLAKFITDKVWADTSFMTSTGLAAASRLPNTLGRGRVLFKP